MLENQSNVHIFINPYLLLNICLVDEPVGVQSSEHTTHCDTEGNPPDFGYVLLFRYGIINILYFALMRDKYNVSYDYTTDNFTIHTP